MRRLDEQLRFFDQVVHRLRIVLLAALLMGLEKVLGELASREWIKEQLRIVEALLKLAYDPVRILRDDYNL